MLIKSLFSFSSESLNSLEYEFEKNEKFTDMEIPVLKHSEIRDLCVYYGHVWISICSLTPSFNRATHYPHHSPHHLHYCTRLLKFAKRIELDSSELDLALRFLTQVGIILHFECEIAGLDELYFIDPAWACRTISEIVLSSKVKNHIEEAGFITSEAGFQILLSYWLRLGR